MPPNARTPPLPRPAAPGRALVAALLLGPTAVGCGGEPASEGPGAGSETAPELVEGPVFPAQNRPDVRGTHGAVTADHPLAAAAGLDVLRRGGNATDAVVAMAAVLAVVRPHMNGVGGDAFALFYDGSTGEVSALNGSGRSGALATPEFFAEAGHEGIPSDGALSVSVPGAVAAWADALERHGSMGLGELLEPAVGYARGGFPVTPRLASDFASQGRSLEGAAAELYLPGGEPPRVGSLLRNPALASTLQRIGAEGVDGFYRGPVAGALADFLEARGGYLRAPDFAAHASTWVEPLEADYLGHTFLVLPPNTQGMAQLQMMEMAKRFDLMEMGHNTSSYLHTLVEIKKLAFADRDRWVADPEHADLPLDRLLDPGYLEARAALVDAGAAAGEVVSGVEGEVSTNGSGGASGAGEGDDAGDTVYLTAVDRSGNAVSWIQSLYAGFGSGLLEPETGVLLQNRGALFTLEEGHPNRVAPRKRPFHTLTPTMALREGGLAFTLGTPGGDSQPQSILQIVNNMLLFGMTPQEAVEAARFRSYGGLSLSLEDRIDPAVRTALEALGHDLRVIEGWTATFGGAQAIVVDPVSGALTAAADPRREAYALAY